MLLGINEKKCRSARKSAKSTATQRISGWHFVDCCKSRHVAGHLYQCLSINVGTISLTTLLYGSAHGMESIV